MAKNAAEDLMVARSLRGSTVNVLRIAFAQLNHNRTFRIDDQESGDNQDMDVDEGKVGDGEVPIYIVQVRAQHAVRRITLLAAPHSWVCANCRHLLRC